MLTSVHISLAKGSHMPSSNFTWIGKYSLAMSLRRAENRSVYALAPFTTRDLNKLMESLELEIMGSNVTTPSEGPVLLHGCTLGNRCWIIYCYVAVAGGEHLGMVQSETLTSVKSPQAGTHLCLHK